jgi:hypothetical protein
VKIDDNVVLEDDGTTTCAHCGTKLGQSQGNPLEHALRREQPSPAAGPGVRVDPSVFTDRPIVLRQAFCPSCLTLLSTEITPSDEPAFRTWKLHA